MGFESPTGGSGGTPTPNIIPADGIVNPANPLQETLDFDMTWDSAGAVWSRRKDMAAVWGTANGRGYAGSGIVLINPQTGTTVAAGQTGGFGDGTANMGVILPGAHPLTNTGAANAAATVTFPANGGGRHRLLFLAWSFSGAAPAAGTTLIVQDGATTVLSVAVPAVLGYQTIPLPSGGLIMAAGNTAMTVTLAAGGAGAIGTVNAANQVATI